MSSKNTPCSVGGTGVPRGRGVDGDPHLGPGQSGFRRRCHEWHTKGQAHEELLRRLHRTWVRVHRDSFPESLGRQLISSSETAWRDKVKLIVTAPLSAATICGGSISASRPFRSKCAYSSGLGCCGPPISRHA